ncbi:MAG: hypothetical protein M3O22_08785 [Pseudomonadota bacterium]|nr:hypothetical protein [Pseudomonadota bacterium]
MTVSSEPATLSFWTRRLSRREVWVYRAVYTLPWVATMLVAVLESVMTLIVGAETLYHDYYYLFELVKSASLGNQIIYIPIMAILFFVIPRLSVRGNTLLALFLPLPFTAAACLFFIAIDPQEFMRVFEPRLLVLPLLSLGISYFYAVSGAIIMFLYSRRHYRRLHAPLPGTTA